MKKGIVGVLLLGFCAASFAQNWPNRPIRVLVGFAPGGTTDVSAPVTGDIVSGELGQPVIVETQPGASGAIAIEMLLRGAADGHTILIGSDSSFYQPVVSPKLSHRMAR